MRVRRGFSMRRWLCSRCRIGAIRGVCPKDCGFTNMLTFTSTRAIRCSTSVSARPIRCAYFAFHSTRWQFRVPSSPTATPPDYARFLHPSQWALIDFDDVLAENWTHPDDRRRYFQHKSRKCAEVLVPHRIPQELLTGAYVIDAAARARLAAHAPHLPVIVDPVLFFHSN